MPDPSSARIFISYSRKDGAKFADRLRKQLERGNLSVWQDLITLEGGRDWWSQIEDALRSKTLQHFVLIVTPAALASPVVRREIRLARQEGKTVSPIKGPGLGELGNLPRWLGQIYDLDLAEVRCRRCGSFSQRCDRTGSTRTRYHLGSWRTNNRAAAAGDTYHANRFRERCRSGRGRLRCELGAARRQYHRL
jgi:hypothetical protein